MASPHAKMLLTSRHGADVQAPVPVVEREDGVLEEAVPQIPESACRVACWPREETVGTRFRRMGPEASDSTVPASLRNCLGHR